jgi:nucleoside-diphosphate-sugar epimerase
VDDVTELVWKAAHADAHASGNVYNAGNGNRYSLNEVWRLLGEITGVELPAQYGPPREGDVRDSQADTTAAVRDLGHAPRFSLEEGLRRTFDWYSSGRLVEAR